MVIEKIIATQSIAKSKVTAIAIGIAGKGRENAAFAVAVTI